MTRLIPNRFLFDFEFILRYRSKIPTLTGKLNGLSNEYLLPYFGELDGAPQFGKLWACWNESGIYIACDVTGKNKPLKCDQQTFWKGDNLRVCTDMRDTRNIKRASRYCQQFFIIPTGGSKRKDKPVAASTPIHRAQQESPPVPVGQIGVASIIRANGYSMEAHIPAASLSGFQPDDYDRIGFYYMLEDSELGQQYLTVGDNLNWHTDPSTWATAVLSR